MPVGIVTTCGMMEEKGSSISNEAVEIELQMGVNVIGVIEDE